jgi:hypothetical protein
MATKTGRSAAKEQEIVVRPPEWTMATDWVATTSPLNSTE